MARHGATVAGGSLRECVFRAVGASQNAEAQARAAALGPLTPLSPGERALVARLSPGGVERAWQYWCARLARP